MTEKWYQIQEKAAGEKRLMLLWYLYLFLGKNFVKVIAFFVSLFTFLFAKEMRNDILKNLEVIYLYAQKNGVSLVNPNLLNSYRIVLNYAFSLVDKMEVFSGRYDASKISFASDEQKQYLYNDLTSKKGIFFICSHTGNIDALRAFLYGYTDIPKTDVNVFLSREQCKIFNSFVKKIELANPVNLLPVEDVDINTSVLLKDRLDAGEIVFIAGDRVSCGNSRISQKITFLGNDIDIPVGTFKLAQMMEAQIYFISALKEKNDKYKVYLQKFMLDGEVLTKKEFLLKMQEEYILFLQEVTLKDCLQFYNFYKLWHN